MTAINRVIKEIKYSDPTLEVAYIRPNEVRQFAEHMRMTVFDPERHSIDWFVKAIEDGGCTIMGIPLRILGR